MNDDLDKLIAAHQADVHEAPAHLKQQWHDAIDDAAALERGRTPTRNTGWHPGSFFWGVAVTAALAVGIGIGYFASDEQNNRPGQELATVASVEPGGVPSPLYRGMQAYLRESGRYLAGVGYGAGEQELVLQILEQNRLFEIAAEQSGSAELARILRAFEPVLVQLAVADLTHDEAEALRARLEFQMKAMLTKLATDPSDETHTT